ncbi:DUF4956 domain-containing protein [Serinibacter salmoneus]|uniref:Uncharacterized protein DUF4956 n=1 Tax=Serinibacter salmoneus TaxID=556530 RepID=A0A2A9D3W2_9MICO|nr:DUF4956 domain-containing protein [Serinibacter salmoneus]PFG20945.1 uncharacterized protein DUF4956 [Serinibacter salmoneus]
MSIDPTITLILADLIAAAVLTFGLYFPRHRRRDLVVAYLGINVGVFAVSAALASSSVGAGLGLGLLGVLSIIRLRSDELSQREVAYYFAALTIGLLGGLAPDPTWLAIAGMALVVAVMWFADHPALLSRARQQVIVVDRAIANEDDLTSHLAALLDANIRTVSVQKLDTVNDTTTVDVRYQLRRAPRLGEAIEAPGRAGAASTVAAATPGHGTEMTR